MNSWWKVIWLAVVVWLATLVGGCGATWRADSVNYVGRPGLKIDVTTGGFGIYIGLDGQLVASGAANSPTPEDVPIPEPEVTP